MSRICFMDLENIGHHWFYNSSLIKAFSINNNISYFTSNLSDSQIEFLEQLNIQYKEVKCFKKFKLYNWFYEVIILINLLRYCNKNNIKKVYLIYFDRFFVSFYLVSFLYRLSSISCVLTLHWFPTNKIKKIVLGRILNFKNVKLIVHTENILAKIKQVNKSTKNVYMVEYPVSETSPIKKEIALERLGITNNKFTLLYFGDTRYDKGLDILLDATILTKTNVNIVIAGKETFFSKSYIEEKLSSTVNKNYFIDLTFIDDEDVKYYFCSADSVILPYRRIFSGESGILTEAINYGIPVIVPDILHFEQVVASNNIGLVYKAEDCRELAQAIDKIVENILIIKQNSKQYSEIYKSSHSISNFVEKYIYINSI